VRLGKKSVFDEGADDDEGAGDEAEAAPEKRSFFGDVPDDSEAATVVYFAKEFKEGTEEEG